MLCWSLYNPQNNEFYNTVIETTLQVIEIENVSNTISN